MLHFLPKTAAFFCVLDAWRWFQNWSPFWHGHASSDQELFSSRLVRAFNSQELLHRTPDKPLRWCWYTLSIYKSSLGSSVFVIAQNAKLTTTLDYPLDFNCNYQFRGHRVWGWLGMARVYRMNDIVLQHQYRDGRAYDYKVSDNLAQRLLQQEHPIRLLRGDDQLVDIAWDHYFHSVHFPSNHTFWRRMNFRWERLNYAIIFEEFGEVTVSWGRIPMFQRVVFNRDAVPWP